MTQMSPRNLRNLRSPVAVQSMLHDLAIQRITVDSKNQGGLGLITTSFGERALDEFFFKFA